MSVERSTLGLSGLWTTVDLIPSIAEPAAVGSAVLEQLPLDHSPAPP